MKYISTILAKNLVALREERGLTRATLAEKAGISQSSYSRYEASGWIADPDMIEKLASFYNVPSSRLFFDPDLEKPLSDSWASRPSPKEIAQKLEEIADLLKR